MPGANSLALIQHVVVLMLENRSFDHMLGYLYATGANMSPAGVSPVPGAAGPAPVTDTALASYIRANA